MIPLFLIGILVIIFAINVIPAFMPPTWMLLSFIGFSFNLSNQDLILISILAAIAATSGRVVLTIFSKKIIRNMILSENTRKNIDVLKQNIENRKIYTFSFFLAYAFSPFPSGQLFLAYGLTDLKVLVAAIPFFIGRMISYLFWAITASKVSERIITTSLKSGTYFSLYFIVAQILSFYLVYLFVKIDWKSFFIKHKITSMKK